MANAQPSLSRGRQARSARRSKPGKPEPRTIDQPQLIWMAAFDFSATARTLGSTVVGSVPSPSVKPFQGWDGLVQQVNNLVEQHRSYIIEVSSDGLMV
jgi:hypothetical protein